MKLIDADEVVITYTDHKGLESDFSKGVEFAMNVYDSQPIVEAIPIEFIKKEMESSRYIWSNSGVKTELYWRGVYQGLMVLIRNWEKEHENI